MNWHTLSLPLIVVSVLLYHFSQKSIPGNADPLIALAAAYLVALCVCATVFIGTTEARRGLDLLRNQNWLVVILLGISVIGVELGVLYAYRTGWRISTTAITTGAFTSTVLALVGVLWYKEELTSLNIGGIVLCIVGVILISWK